MRSRCRFDGLYGLASANNARFRTPNRTTFRCLIRIQTKPSRRSIAHIYGFVRRSSNVRRDVDVCRIEQGELVSDGKPNFAFSRTRIDRNKLAVGSEKKNRSALHIESVE